MSKPVKEMILAEYQKRFAGLDGALLIDIRGIDANENNTLRLDLATKGIRVTVVKNSLARKAFAGTGLDALQSALDGPSARSGRCHRGHRPQRPDESFDPAHVCSTFLARSRDQRGKRSPMGSARRPLAANRHRSGALHRTSDDWADDPVRPGPRCWTR